MKRIFISMLIAMSIYVCAEIPVVDSFIGLFREEGMCWRCARCKHNNWKQNPPYTCSHCGTIKGRQ